MIFDSLVHPDPSGRWMFGRHERDASAATLRSAMERNGVTRALAVGLGAGMPGYDPSTYADWVSDALPGAVPVAFADLAGFGSVADVHDAVARCADLGYRAMKVHPRISAIGFNDERFAELLRVSADQSLVVLVCTFNFGHRDPSCDVSPESLISALDAAPGARVVALHGGGPDLLRWAEHVRVRRDDDLLLDLSMTLVRYAGSSLDSDLRFVARTLDQRTCVGSDFPDSSVESFRGRLDWLLEGLEQGRRERISHDNLARWFPDES